MKKSLCGLIAAVSMFALHAQAAQPPAAAPAPANATAPVAMKTDYSGKWKLNIDKSDFGQIPPPTSESQVITQTPDQITIARTSVREQAEQSYTMSVKLDGTDTPVPAGAFPDDAPFKIVGSKAEWDGSDLTISQNTTYQGAAGKVKAKYTLSPDGKVLTVSTDISMSMGDFTIKSVYEKQ